jgi:hypothetical protein
MATRVVPSSRDELTLMQNLRANGIGDFQDRGITDNFILGVDAEHDGYGGARTSRISVACTGRQRLPAAGPRRSGVLIRVASGARLCRPADQPIDPVLHQLR